MVIGLIVIYAISPGLSAHRGVSQNYYVSKQLIAIVLGIVSFVIAMNIPLRMWRQLVIPLGTGAAIATLIALILPVSPDYPAHRWLRLGGLSVQSVELVKLAILIGLAGFLASVSREQLQKKAVTIFRPLLILLVVIGIVVAVLQRDLGSTGVLVAMVAMMSFIAGLPVQRFLIIGGIIVVATFLLVVTSAERRDRVTNFLHPESNCQTTGYQACQALAAVGSGGLFGKGLGHSVYAYGYLPEAANDSIFAIMAEKFGFVGVSVLICLFGVLFARLKTIMERTADSFSQLVVAGVLAWLSTQTIMNIGAMIGLLPLKGITLPFISYGGTSIVFTAASIGLVFQISRYTTHAPSLATKERERYENTTMRRRDRRPHYSQFSRRP